jgi:proton-dependent oligopeptide transporter, POT family
MGMPQKRPFNRAQSKNPHESHDVGLRDFSIRLPSAYLFSNWEASMSDAELKTSPDHEETGWPKGVPYIVGNEMCERFSYYGMRAILTVHLVSLYVLSGHSKDAAEAEATATYHMFAGAVYAVPMIGALLADRLLGKFNVILWLSLMYCVGHGILAIADIPGDPNTRLTLVYIGLACIAIGAGGIKPCVSANVGDQFGRGNWHRVRAIYQIFYFSINFGSFFATLMIPFIRGDGTQLWRVSLAFGIPGVLMAIATFFFWLGRKKFVHVPPRPSGHLGKLDALAGTVIFMAIGHLYLTPADWGWFIRGGISAGFVIAGIMIFFYRQSIEQDDGFLAIVLFNLRAKLSGDKAAQVASGQASSMGIRAVDGEADQNDDKAQVDSDSPLVKSPFWSKFWGPAIERFGLEAAEGPHAVFKICTIFIFIPVFWAIFDQHGSTWIIQAQSMDCTLFGWEVLPEQVSATNPLMVMFLIPILNVIYRGFDKIGLEATPLRRMVTGMLMASASFAIAALIQEAIDANGAGVVSIWWQVLAYLVLTTAEVLLSITALEFAYTQAPKRMKSVVMGLFLLTVTLGNAFVSGLTMAKDNIASVLNMKFGEAEFFWFFCLAAIIVGVLMGIRGAFYVQRDFTQD